MHFKQIPIIIISFLLIINIAFALELALDLEKTKYSNNESLKGNLNIKFTDIIDADSKVTIEVGDDVVNMDLTELFYKLNISSHKTETRIIPTGEAQTKSMNIKSSEPSVLVLKLPKDAKVNEVNMNIRGETSNPPSFLYMDIGDDGKKEWHYFGTQTGWKGEVIYPASLDETQEGASVILNSNTTYYCEAIELPYSKDFKVSVKYKRNIEGSDIKATILSFYESGSQGTAQGGSNLCDLEDNVAAASWNSCAISFDYAIQGRHILCAYITNGGQDYYTIFRDNSASGNRYECGLPIGGFTHCNKQDFKDYYMSVSGGEYNKDLSSNAVFGDWFTDVPFNESLTQYLSQCTPYEVGDCAVPIYLYSEKDGNLEISNLLLYYTEKGGSTVSTASLYSFSEEEAKIRQINGVNLSTNETSVTIPLSKFSDLKAPSVSDGSQKFNLKARIGSDSTSEVVRVYAGAVPDEKGRVDSLIETAQTALSSLKTQQAAILGMFDIDTGTKLDTYKTQADKVGSDENVTEEKKEQKYKEIEEDLLSYINSLPEKITTDRTFVDEITFSKSDIPSSVDEPDEAIAIQDKFTVKVNAKEYSVTYYSKEKKKYTVIEKIITPNELVKEVDIYEIIPKSIASNINNVKWSTKDYEVVEADPVVKFSIDSLSSGQQKKIVYGLEKAISNDLIYNTKTILVPQKPIAVEKTEFSCGDGICTQPVEDEISCPQDCTTKRRLPLFLIILAIIVIIGGYIYINYYWGKYDIRRFSKWDKYFETKTDLANIKTFIRDSVKKNMDKQGISAVLISKGWTKDQIRYAFNDLEWDKRRALLSKNTPALDADMSKLKEYINKCFSVGVDSVKILTSLRRKGWTEERIVEAFKDLNRINDYNQAIKIIKQAKAMKL